MKASLTSMAINEKCQVKISSIILYMPALYLDKNDSLGWRITLFVGLYEVRRLVRLGDVMHLWDVVLDGGKQRLTDNRSELRLLL